MRVTINVPTKKGKKTVNVKASGNLIRVELLEGLPKPVLVRCILQDEYDGEPCPVQLTHFASGQTLCSANTLEAVKVRRMAQISTYTKTSDRQAAIFALRDIIARIGIDRFNEIADKAPVLNT